ncbi:MAG: hypothetical protein GC206_13315 [Alphaproteobacteria bacterium]|nr:hypothetical protein [Alphaproteobacteria bacterium]
MTQGLVTFLLVLGCTGVACAALYAVAGKGLRAGLVLALSAVGFLIAAQLDARFAALLAAFAFGGAG